MELERRRRLSVTNPVVRFREAREPIVRLQSILVEIEERVELVALRFEELLGGHLDHFLHAQRGSDARLDQRAEMALTRTFNTLEVVVTHARSPPLSGR